MPVRSCRIHRPKTLALLLLPLLIWSGAVRAQEAPTGVETAWENGDVSPAACAFNPDGTRLACSTHQGGIAVVDAETGELLRVFGSDDFDQRTPPDVLAWGPDGRRVAVASTVVTGAQADRAVVLYAAETGERLEMLEFGTAPHSVAFGPGGQRLAVASMYDDTPGPLVRLYDLENGTVLHEAPLNPGRYDGPWDRVVAFNPDGDSLVLGGAALELWEPSAEPRGLYNAGGFVDAVTSVDWSPGGVAIAFVAGFEKVLLRNGDTEASGSSEMEWSETEGGSDRGGQPVIAFDGSGRLVAVSPAGILKIWSVEADPQMTVPTGSEIFSHRVPEATQMAWHGDSFVLTDDESGSAPLTMLSLVYDEDVAADEDAAAGEDVAGVTAEDLAALLPAELPGGFRRADVETDRGAPSVSARYEREDETLGLEVMRLDAEGMEEMRSLFDHLAASPEEEVWKDTYRGHPLYDSHSHDDDIPDVIGEGVVLLVPGFYLEVSGRVPHQALHAALDAIDLEALAALGPNAGGGE